jgi:DNA end-binding protein Ku
VFFHTEKKGETMASRAVWTGTINFGLVSIQIEMFSAIAPHVIGFKLLHSVCNTPIINKRWCPYDNREVSWEETVKGLKLKDGSYFVLTQENIKKLKPEKTDTISVVEFVDTEAVSPLYYDSHYYVAPQKETDKAFFLFAEALKKSKQSAVGQFVMRDKEYVCLVQPYENALLLSTLNYDYEIKHVEQVSELKPVKVSESELKLAYLLMDKLYKKKFDISAFKDTFATKLAQAIKLKEKGKIVEVEKVKPSAAPPASLMEALKASLKEYEKPAAEKSGSERRSR